MQTDLQPQYPADLPGARWQPPSGAVAEIVHPGSLGELVQGQIVQVDVACAAENVTSVYLKSRPEQRLKFFTVRAESHAAESSDDEAEEACQVLVVIHENTTLTTGNPRGRPQQLMVQCATKTLPAVPCFTFTR